MTKKNRRNKRIKILRNRCLFLLGAIAIFIISYKSYNYFHIHKIKSGKVISTDQLSTNKTYKNGSFKKAGENNSQSNDNKETNIKENTTKNKDNSTNKINLSNNVENDADGNVSSDGKQYAYDAQKVKDILDNNFESDGEKIAFLTFDDGPSTSVTPQILDTLKNYDVKATFFLIGQNIQTNERSKELVKQIFEDGHAIGNHTYSHNMRKLYPGNKLDVDYLMGEVEQTDTDIRNIVGQGFNTRILRLPGGYMSRVYYNDPNLNEFNERLKEKNMYSIDWNAYDFDAEGRWKNSEELLECVKESVGTKEKVVILMHDTYGKEETAKALPQIIEYLRTQGYEFKTIN
ncbi:polysaccharide deacetylase family protein [Clostridium kluyveri]|uniref:Polysaccharide deacetylase n=1 Tax=Clostridium kluyveri TaxID=1534 RepID=A0A1L5F918_CLOKL|nr:polysaccharide deacetylase family protein [Clostridium kluyveri]APM39514.1 polysaccharide deacetylase [Clostridium kluyveri]UZQ50326.1 polysaccharide deacetylase [Clostridium kluyveri]